MSKEFIPAFTSEFIPYLQAIELKKLGFDKFCLGRYCIITEWEELTGDILLQQVDCLLSDKYLIKAPLWQQAFTWFRDRYKILAVIDSPCDGIGYFYGFNRIETPLIRGHNFIQGSDKTYITYEEAQLACLKQLIEIVKQK